MKLKIRLPFALRGMWFSGMYAVQMRFTFSIGICLKENDDIIDKIKNVNLPYLSV